jgi:platelet-activating factor acetylhydrolase
VLLKQTVDPKRALDLNIDATLEFLKLVMKGRTSIIERTLKAKGILAVPVLPEMPTDHKPSGKWIAMRLHIPHEFKSRILPNLRKVNMAVNGERSPDQEIWMHISSTLGDVHPWKRKKASSNLEKYVAL